MGLDDQVPMRLKDFMADSLQRTGDQIRESTRREYKSTMEDFIACIGDIDYQAVRQKHGEQFVQYCFDNSNSPATVAKKIRQLKRFFQLAVHRGQLDDNPFKNIKQPKSPKRKIRIYTADECLRIIKAAQSFRDEFALKWDLLIVLALTTGMRRSELLNSVWSDINFESKTIEVQPKKDTDKTWEWAVKDTDCRTLPLTDEVVQLLVDHQAETPAGYPYVFLPPERYDRILEIKQAGSWTFSDARIKVVNNFTRHFSLILSRAGIQKGQFHDLRRTALSNWFAQGLSEYDVMNLAGHANFSTTKDFYLTITDDLVWRAREAISHQYEGIFGTHP